MRLVQILFFRPLLWALAIIFGRKKLRAVELVGIGSTVSQAIELYGAPIESSADDWRPDAKAYTFQAGIWHEVRVVEWQGTIHALTCFSERAYPSEDLSYLLKTYSGGHEWRVLTEGYLYQRSDGALRVWCSAMPAIGVGTSEYLKKPAKPE